MTDVIKIALQRRAELSAELSRLDDFIRMAESLVQDAGSPAMAPPMQSNVTPVRDDADTPPRSSGRPAVFRQKAT
ncbi:MAG: hypothetical protein AAGI70_16880 [Pseudomonadota bacterium]